MSIPVQTPSRKFRGSLCSLPRKLSKVTPSGVKVNLAEKIIKLLLKLKNVGCVQLCAVFSGCVHLCVVFSIDQWTTRARLVIPAKYIELTGRP